MAEPVDNSSRYTDIHPLVPVDIDGPIHLGKPEWVVCDYDKDGYSGAEPHFRRPTCVNPHPVTAGEGQ